MSGDGSLPFKCLQKYYDNETISFVMLCSVMLTLELLVGVNDINQQALFEVNKVRQNTLLSSRSGVGVN